MTNTNISIKSIRLNNDIVFNSNDRLCAFGKSGTGKTTFVKRDILPRIDRYVFHDIQIKNNDAIHDIVATTPGQLKEYIKTYNRILYQPENLEPDDFNQVCETVFKHENMLLYVDEVTSISATNKVEYWHKKILTQGRGRNVGIINTSQRPSDIHNTIISESNQFFVFRLTLDPDINKLNKIIGSATSEIRILPKFHFLYYSEDSGKRMIFDPYLNYYTPNLRDYITLLQSYEE